MDSFNVTAKLSKGKALEGYISTFIASISCVSFYPACAENIFFTYNSN